MNRGVAEPQRVNGLLLDVHVPFLEDGLKRTAYRREERLGGSVNLQ